MHFGSEAIFTEEGLIVSSGMTSALGIRDGSRCWGTWVSDARGESDLPHFLISPIPPRCWLRAFRIDLKIRHERGAMYKAAKALADHMNILFAECAPSGHHHATWNIVAEVTANPLFGNGDHVRRKLEELGINPSEEEVRRTLASYINDDVTRAIRSITDAVKEADEGEDGGFLYQKSKGSVIYEQQKPYSDSVGGRYVHRVAWMETLAVFTAYSQLPSTGFVRFVYDEQNSTFKSQGIPSFAASLTQHAKAIEGRLPMTTIASLDVNDRTIRASLSRDDIGRQKISVRIPYRIPRGKSNGSQGILKDFCEKFQDMNLLQVTNSITDDEQEEQGALNFLASPTQGRYSEIVTGKPGTSGQLQALEGLKVEIKKIKEARKSRNQRPAVIAVHDTFELFVSTKLFLWERRQDIHPRLEELAGRYGFRLTRVSNEDVERTYEGRRGSHISEQVMRKIESCDAILQLWPQAPSSEEESVYQWLQWELGLALGQGKIAILCFDSLGQGEIPDWAKHAANVVGLFNHKFDSGVDAGQIMRALEPGIAEAAAKVRSARP